MLTTPARFNIKLAALILLLVSLWVIAWVFLLLIQTPSSGVYPTLWVFSSAISLLLWLIYRFEFRYSESLKLNWPKFIWILTGIVLAFVYWQLDQWLVKNITTNNLSYDIIKWQNSVKGYWIYTVALSSIILAPLFEELFFRGLLLNILQRLVNDWLAIVTSALLFAIIHWSWPEFLSLFFVGVIYGWLTLKSNSVLPAIMAHIIHNALTFGLYVLF